MISVRQASLDLFRSYGLTTWFGNPGSSELTLLEDFPDDFRYVLGLQEMVPVGMADAYAQITRRPAVVNVHTAPGVGNAQGALYNAFVNKTPLIVTAGNQRRFRQNQYCLLTNIDPTTVPKPRSTDGPGRVALGQVILIVGLWACCSCWSAQLFLLGFRSGLSADGSGWRG